MYADGKQYLAGKVQPVPKETRPDTTVEPEGDVVKDRQREKLKKKGVVQAIEKILKQFGPSRFSFINTNLKALKDSWKTEEGLQTKSIGDVIKLFPEKFEVDDQLASLIGDDTSVKERAREELADIADMVEKHLRVKGPQNVAQVTKDLGLKNKDKKFNARISRAIGKNKWLFTKNFYALFPEKFKITDSTGGTGGVLSLKSSGLQIKK